MVVADSKLMLERKQFLYRPQFYILRKSIVQCDAPYWNWTFNDKFARNNWIFNQSKYFFFIRYRIYYSSLASFSSFSCPLDWQPQNEYGK